MQEQCSGAGTADGSHCSISPLGGAGRRGHPGCRGRGLCERGGHGAAVLERPSSGRLAFLVSLCSPWPRRAEAPFELHEPEENQVSFIGVSRIFSQDRKILFAQWPWEWVFSEWFPGWLPVRPPDLWLLSEAWKSSPGTGEKGGLSLPFTSVFLKVSLALAGSPSQRELETRCFWSPVGQIAWNSQALFFLQVQ